MEVESLAGNSSQKVHLNPRYQNARLLMRFCYLYVFAREHDSDGFIDRGFLKLILRESYGNRATIGVKA
jgi:hypothetical protein